MERQFAPPIPETVVESRNPADGARLRAALVQLAEQDPLINVQQDRVRQEISVSLYGEVQQEVIQATLASDFGLDVAFRGATLIHVERPVGTGHAVELLQDESNPFSATIGLRVEPAPVGSGISFSLDVDPRHRPIYIYKSTRNFAAAMTEYVRLTLREGRYGWSVSDCVVAMDECAYYVGDAQASQGQRRARPPPTSSS